MCQCAKVCQGGAVSARGGRWASRPAESNRTGAASRLVPSPRLGTAGWASALGWHTGSPWHMEHSPLRRHMTLAHWHTEVCQWHTCATEVCQTKSSRSGLKLTLHRFSARFDEVEKSWHTGTPESHQPCWTARHVGAMCQSGACGAHSVCGSSFFFSVKKRDTGVPVCQPRDDPRR